MSAHALARPRALRSEPSLWRQTAQRWLARLQERDAMARMSLRDMRDAGLTPYDVAQECGKPFWKE